MSATIAIPKLGQKQPIGAPKISRRNRGSANGTPHDLIWPNAQSFSSYRALIDFVLAHILNCQRCGCLNKCSLNRAILLITHLGFLIESVARSMMEWAGHAGNGSPAARAIAFGGAGS